MNDDVSFQIGALCPYNDTIGNCGQYNETLQVESAFDHPGYDPSTKSHDLTLVKLQSQSTVQPVAIDQNISLSNDTLYLLKSLWAVGEL